MHNNIKAILWMVATGFVASIINALAKHLGQQGYHAFQLLFFYNAGALLCLLPFLLRKQQLGTNKQLPMLSLRAVLEFGGFSLSFYGLSIMPLPMHTAMSFLAPLLASVLAILILKESNSLHRWLGLCMGLAGVWIINQPQNNLLHTGAWVMIGSAICFSGCTLCLRSLSQKLCGFTVAFYMVLLTGLVSLPFAFYVWKPLQAEHYTPIAAIGVLVALVQYTVSRAFQSGEVTLVTPILFLNLIWASLIAVVIFKEQPNIETWVGAALILTGTLYGAYKATRKARTEDVASTNAH